MESLFDDSPVKVKIGGFCVKGGGHIWTYDPGHTDGPDGCSGWDLTLDIHAEDVHVFPEWVQEAYQWALKDRATGE